MTFYPEFNPEFIPEFYPEFIPASVYIVDLRESDEPQTPWVSVTRVRNTSVGTWIPAWALGSPSLAMKRPKDI